MEYSVITAHDLKELVAKVNEALQLGWRLQGGVSSGMGYDQYFQAIVRG